MPVSVPFSPPDLSDLERQKVQEVLASGWLTTGPKTKEFEERITRWCQSGGTICLNSATAALELSLRLLGIGPGDEVITTPYTYTATASAIYHTRAKIVLADICPNSYELDWQEAAKKITNKTKAIIVVDVGGVPCSYDAWRALAEDTRPRFVPSSPAQHQLGRVALIADGAHSFGAQYKGSASGSLADFTAFSFHAVKNLTTGEGGALTWRRGLEIENLYRQAQLFSLHGQTKDAFTKNQAGAWEYDILCPGWKWNMTDLAAAIGLGQLERYPQMLQRRRQCLEVYRQELERAPVELLCHPVGQTASSCHLAMVQLKNCGEQRRGGVIGCMAQQGVATNVHYKPLPMLTAYRNMGFRMEDFPNAYRRYESEITLPLFSAMQEAQAHQAAKALLAAIKE